jgi:hypothetical protein
MYFNTFILSNSRLVSTICKSKGTKLYAILAARRMDTVKNKPVGDRDHEVLGMGSFGEYKLYARELSTNNKSNIMYSWPQLHHYKG